jgi:hypothetical protein
VSTNPENNLLCLTSLHMTTIFRHANTPLIFHRLGIDVSVGLHIYITNPSWPWNPYKVWILPFKSALRLKAVLERWNPLIFFSRSLCCMIVYNVYICYTIHTCTWIPFLLSLSVNILISNFWYWFLITLRKYDAAKTWAFPISDKTNYFHRVSIYSADDAVIIT